MGSLYKREGSPVWQAAYTDHRGKRLQKSTGTKSKKLAGEIMANWETEANKRKRGLIDPAAERLQVQFLRPISEHLDEWINSLESKGDNAKYTERCRAHVQTVLDKFAIESLLEYLAERVESHAAEMRRAEFAPRTIGSHLRSLKSFSRWCVTTGRLASDPLIGIKIPNPNSKRTIVRRAMPIDQWQTLQHFCIQHAPHRYGMTGTERATLYHLCLITGLRASETATVTIADLYLDSDPPFLTAPASITKNRKAARQYLTADLVTEIRVLLADGRTTAFQGMPSSDVTAEMIRADLLDARKAAVRNDKTLAKSDYLVETDAAGSRYDFHALRHTCGAWLAMTGAHPKIVQTIMRHGTITLTMDSYGHLFPGDESTAVSIVGRRLSQHCQQ